jgi:hypothetical protein
MTKATLSAEWLDNRTHNGEYFSTDNDVCNKYKMPFEIFPYIYIIFKIIYFRFGSFHFFFFFFFFKQFSWIEICCM